MFDHGCLPPLSCSVRGCGKPLSRPPQSGRALVCAAGHSFDIARAGYVNLLQPQDRRSREPGDSAAQVQARSRLFERGIGTGLYALVAGLVGDPVNRAQAHKPWNLEVGCGPGLGLAQVRSAASPQHPESGQAADSHVGFGWIGLDLALAAIEPAAKRMRDVAFVIANADRRLPVLDQSIDCILSVTGPKHYAEFARVLRPNGRAIVAIPAADDLIELRAAVLGQGQARERTPSVLESSAPFFRVAARHAYREQRLLEPDQIHDVLLATYRGGRRREAERAAEMQACLVTLASDVLVLEAKAARETDCAP